jgi:type IV pilus assembly protein PilW
MNAFSKLSRSRMRGVGLIEIMVGLTAGLILLGVLAYFYLGGKQASRTHNDVARMQENGRMAMETLGRAIRQAGARTDVLTPVANALSATEGSSGAPDSITISYVAQNTATAAGGEVDCVGTTIPAGSTVTQTFTVDTTIPALTCTTPANAAAGGAPVVVEENIENMQLTYGVDTSSPKDGRIEAYQTANDVADFSQVAAVSISLLVRGPTPLAAANGGASVAYNGGTVAADGRLRQVYAATFAVRNQSL